ncbi:hypothetical protein [Haloquadratum walsbyi]|uniref:hypothetical protein n=1 Tax=Haloquadratum walsbyi TaxID=293091 RepID=UPI0023F1F14C|nr:hypothetical protein [Haloquadratum walsbyi]
MTQDDAKKRILQVLAHGRSNTHHIYQQSNLDDEVVPEVLAQLCASGLVTEVDRGLYSITPAGLDRLDHDYPSEAGFLTTTEVIHDAPTIKTIRLHGDRQIVETQVDDESVTMLADALYEVLTGTHAEDEITEALKEFLNK